MMRKILRAGNIIDDVCRANKLNGYITWPRSIAIGTSLGLFAGYIKAASEPEKKEEHTIDVDIIKRSCPRVK